MSSFKEMMSAPIQLGGEEFRCLFEHSRDAQFLENGDGYIIDVNTAACELTESARTELTGRHASELLPPSLQKRSDSANPLQRSVLAWRGGSQIVRVLSTPMKVHGEPARLVTIWPLDENSENGNDAPSTYFRAPTEAMEHMAGRLAHDFNNILTTITGTGSMMESDLETGVVRTGDVRRIIDATRDAKSVTTDLLRFSGRSSIATPGTVDLNAFLGAKENSLRRRVGPDIEVKFELDTTSPRVEASEEQLEEILLRIGENVRDFAPPRSRMLITTSSRELDAHFCSSRSIEPGNYAVLRIEDNGPGMTKEVAARAFDPFYTTMKDAVARGLGLSVVHGLVNAMDGHVELSTTPGEGATFTIYFPTGATDRDVESATNRADEAQGAGATKVMKQTDTEETPTNGGTSPPLPAHQTPETADLPNGGETVLVVEDEPMVRELVTRSLGHLGYNVIKAENGVAGVEAARKHASEIDMIFSDIVMPRMSGPEMVAKLREENLEFRVLYTTGFTDNHRILDDGEIREGVNLLPKPYTTRTLSERIRSVLDAARV